MAQINVNVANVQMIRLICPADPALFKNVYHADDLSIALYNDSLMSFAMVNAKPNGTSNSKDMASQVPRCDAKRIGSRQ